MRKKRIVVAMSGGVDSSTAAALCVERGHEVIGVTLKLLPRLETGFGCCGSPADIEDASKVCERLKIAHYTLNLWELFEEKVIRPFVSSYLEAKTPNPCVECNRHLKFSHLLKLAESWQADFLATGHYARVVADEPGISKSKISNRESKIYRLLQAKDMNKDQSYFLHSLTQAELSKVIFPLGEMTKEEVRLKAKELGLHLAEKPESQEICFVPNRDYRSFVKSRIPEPEGDSGLEPGQILDGAGKVLGRHQGLAHYTLGQRQGLGIAAGKPVYVVSMDKESNTLVVGEASEAQKKEFLVEQVTWTRPDAADGLSRKISVRIRHRSRPAPASLEVLPDHAVKVVLDLSQWAPTPGQSAVFYDGEEVLGGGIIKEVIG